MGYESRLYVVKKSIKFFYEVHGESKCFSKVIARFDLDKVYGAFDIINTKWKKSDCYIYADEDYYDNTLKEPISIEITEDRYGESLRETTVSEAIKMLNQAIEQNDYWTYKPCLTFLKSIEDMAINLEDDDYYRIVVLHYGY